MKTRLGFVSNSSSSSFILAVPKNTVRLSVSVKTSVNLFDFVQEVMKTRKDVIDYFNAYFDRDISECPEGWLNGCLDAIERGDDVFVGSVSDESGISEALLVDSDFVSDAEFNIDGIEVIHKEAGY